MNAKKEVVMRDVEIFKRGWEALHAYSGTGMLSQEQKSDLEDMLKKLLSIINKLIIACQKNTHPPDLEYVKKALQDLHSHTNYTHIEKMVRDISDICVTVRSVIMGVTRKTSGKIFEATVFCSFMKT